MEFDQATNRYLYPNSSAVHNLELYLISKTYYMYLGKRYIVQKIDRI
jgi:hypothetical protein